MSLPRDRVTVEDLAVAIAWLDCNEGGGGESESCRRVGKLLQAELDRRQDTILRKLAKEAGVPLAAVKARLAALQSQAAEIETRALAALAAAGVHEGGPPQGWIVPEQFAGGRYSKGGPIFAGDIIEGTAAHVCHELGITIEESTHGK